MLDGKEVVLYYIRHNNNLCTSVDLKWMDAKRITRDVGTGKNQAHLEPLFAIHVVDLALVLVRKDVIGLAYLLKLLLSLLSVVLVLVRMPVQSK